MAPGTFETWWTAARESIVIDSRLPRALTAAVVGASLAMSGAVAQAVTRNPLADPYLLGVSSGAGFMVVLVSVLGFGAGLLGVFTIPVAAFVGAMIPLFLALLIGGRYPQPTAIILVGVALAQIFSALITFCILVLADDRHVTSVMHWIAGGFGDARWSTLIFPTITLAVVGTALLFSSRWMDVLQTGDDGAAALGMNVRRFRVLFLARGLRTGGRSSQRCRWNRFHRSADPASGRLHRRHQSNSDCSLLQPCWAPSRWLPRIPLRARWHNPLKFRSE